MENYGRLRKTIPKEANSMNKFVRQFNENKADNSFCKAEDIVPISSNMCVFPSLSKLSLKRPPTKLAPIFSPRGSSQSNKRKQPTGGGGGSKNVGGIEFLPIPKKKPLLEKSQSLESTSSTSKNVVKLRFKPERQQVAITGSVQFVLKTFKLYPDLKAICEVYGNVMKITKTKIKLEHIILLRNEAGPVLQAVFYDFNNILLDFPTACSVRCVGNFTSPIRFHIHKIERIQGEPQESELNRIQNVTAFSLIQIHNDSF